MSACAHPERALAKRGRGRRTRGFALADFLAGTLILAGAVATWAALTRAQFDTAGAAERRARALYAADEALARFRARPDAAARSAVAAPAAGGFGEIETFEVGTLARPIGGGPVGRLEARRLQVEADGAKGPAACEVRAVLVWRGGPGADDRLSLSTIVVGGDRGR